MNDQVYDYIIIGAGAAGLHLAMAFIDDPAFQNARILILEKDRKDTNDRTWSFWEEGPGRWDSLAEQVWHRGTFIDSGGEKALDMGGYAYKTLRSKPFYAYAKERIDTAQNIWWVQEGVSETKGSGPVEVVTPSGTFIGKHIFDSRITPGAFAHKGKYIYVIQHFKGWIIESEQDIFDPEAFVMMDFRLRWQDTTSFMYILPSSARRALLEFTFFSPDLVTDEVYEGMIRTYIDSFCGIGKYQILEEEKGRIPMTDYPFQHDHAPGITKIGTAGGWVKPSSGYSFKNAERFAQEILKNIKAGRVPHNGIATGRHRRFDILFLDLLNRQNEIGPELFSSMYTRLPAHLIFKFLDEQTSLLEDIRIVSAFRPWPFIASLFRNIATVARM